MKKILKLSLLAVLTVTVIFSVFAISSSAAVKGKWITAWSTAPIEINLVDYDEAIELLGSVNTRTIITPTASGNKIRLKFSNYYGKEDLVITNATVAYSKGGSKIDKASVVPLTFDGKKGVTIKPGKEIYCDSVDFNVTAMDDLAVSIFLKELKEIRTMGLSGGKTYITYDNSKDATSSESFNTFTMLDMDEKLQVFLNSFLSLFLPEGVLDPSLSFDVMDVIPCVSSVEVFNSKLSSYSVVVLGDSTVANDFPKYLAQYIVSKGVENVGISGKGVIGNRILDENVNYNSFIKSESLMDRLSREVLGADGKNRSNVRYVIIKAGANDIIDAVCQDVKTADPTITQPTALDIKIGFKKIFNFCHENGIKVVVVGITPWKGATMDYFGTGTANYDRTDAEIAADWKIAKSVNNWLKTCGYHDGYVDFNSFSVSESDSLSLNPAYTQDGINPTPALAKRWAKEFKKSLIGIGTSVQGIKLSDKTKTIYKGETATLTATVTPEKAKNKSVIWTSSDTSVATVDKNGVVTAVSNGFCKITATTKESGFTARCAITVATKPESITIKKDTSYIYTTQQLKLKAVVLPADCSYKTVKWTTSDKEIATVSSKGVVTGVGAGTVTIKAISTFDRSIVASCKIKVTKKVSVEGLTLNHDIAVKYKGDSFTYKATVLPANATFKDVTWSSSDTSIATVDKNGRVTAKSAGVAVITCTSNDNPLCKATSKFKVKIRTTGVEMWKSKLNMYVSQQLTFKANVFPSDASNKNVSWTSSDTSVATVDESGRVTAKKTGTAIITAITEKGGYRSSCTVTVKKYVAVKSVTLNKTTLSIRDGNTYTLKATINPDTASNKKLIWSSTDKSVATVSSSGVITGVNPGTCKIVCKSADTGKKAVCTLTVKKVSVESVSFAKSTYKVNYGESIKLSVEILPANASNQNVTWTSSNTAYAKVTSKGKVTGLKAGTSVTITATTEDGKKVATCKVKVLAVAVTGVTLDKKAISINVGKSAIITPTVLPANASNKAVTWLSSDPKVASISDQGIVKALKPGTVVVACKTVDGSFVAYCVVNVSNIAVTAVYLDNSSIMANKGASFYLVPTIVPFDATNKNVTWSSSNTAVARVSSTGKVTAVGFGTCYITVTTKDGGHTSQCKVTVV